MTLFIMRPRQVARQLVQFRGANRTDGAHVGAGVGVGGSGGVFGVAERGFQRGETGGEGDVEEGAGGKGE